MNLAKQFREFGVLNSINPLPPDAQVIWYNLMQCFNTARWIERKLVVRTQTLENLCGMTRKRLATSRNVLIQRGLIKYYPSKQASGSPSYEVTHLYDDNDSSSNGVFNPNSPPVFPTETHRGTQEGTQEGTQMGTQREHLLKTKLNEKRAKATPPVQRTLNFETNLIFDVESELSKNQILLEKICMAARKPMQVALVSLRRYHLHLEENEKYPVSRKGSFAGFEKWLMNERIQSSDLHTETNGTIKNATEEASKRVLDQFE